MREGVASIAVIGFGEAATAFAECMDPARLCAFDIKTESAETAAAKRADYAATGVQGADCAAAAVRGAHLILSLVTADQALAAAASVARAIEHGALFYDMNSVAPHTKREAAALIESAGGRYVDVAIMAPVRPARTAVPLLVSGPHGEVAAKALRSTGFANVTALPGPVGAASAIKMIRSVMIKGMEALSAECLIAAEAAGVSNEVIASLDASWPGADWAQRGDYNLDRMLVHGIRRAAEMEEVVKTLEALGLSGGMARATAGWQRAIGALGLASPPGIAAKAAAILGAKADAA